VKILVADDDPVSLRMIERMLQHIGYEVITADNGERPRTSCPPGRSPPFLIDWMMPQLDGPDLCREVRDRNDDLYTYILLLTAKQSREDVVIGLKRGPTTT